MLCLTSVAVQVNGFPNESVPTPFHSLPLETPLSLVAVSGKGCSAIPGKRAPIPAPRVRVLSKAGRCLTGAGA